MIPESEIRGEESVSADISGEVRGKQWKSLSLVLLLAGFGLVAASDYDGAFNRSGAILFSQVLYDCIGVILVLSLFFAPFAGRWGDVRRWATRGFFALGIVFLMVPLSPWYCDVNSQRWWIQLLGFRVNLCIWSELFILPVIVRTLARPFTRKHALFLIGLLCFVNISLHSTRSTSAIVWFNCVIALLLLATLSSRFRAANTLSRRDRIFRICLIALLIITVVSPITSIFYNPYARNRLIELCTVAWTPEHMKNYNTHYQPWMIYRNFRDGGLTGSSNLLTIRQCVGFKSSISEYALQMVGFRFGLVGVSLVLAASVWLARLWIRHALYAPTLELRLWRLGLSLFLVFHMFASAIRTTGLIQLMPATSYPFLAYGANITLWSFACLGLLLQKSCVTFTLSPIERHQEPNAAEPQS
jgi:cell division protein FtsW (lipid II flippase)